MKMRWAVCVVSVLVGGRAVVAQTSKPWKAQWITAADAPQRDEVVLHFR